MGGTMRLGAWPCKLEPGSFAHKAYGKLEIRERHRHRYEFNRDFEKTLVAACLKITGRTPDENYVEIVEAPEHPWFHDFQDRKSTRLNSSHSQISYAVFCLKQKNNDAHILV